MNIVDLLVTIVVVTILVTIVLAVITYIAYKLRLAREPARAESENGPRYFVTYAPSGARQVADGAGGSRADAAPAGLRRDMETPEAHATEA